MPGDGGVEVRAFKRLRESAATLAAIGFVMTAVTVCSLGAVVYLDEQGTRGLQTALAERSGADLALRASLRYVDDTEQQDREVRSAIAQTFAGSGVDVEVTRTLVAHVTVHPVDDDPETVDRGGSAASIPDFETRVELVDGRFATGATEVVVQADAADELGLVTGQDVLIEGERFTVSGTWRPTDPLDPRWYGNVMIVTGYDDDFGPFVINVEAWRRLDTSPEVFWTVVADARTIDSRNAATVVSAWGSITDDWRRDVSGIQTLSSQNRLVQTLRELQVRLDGLRAVEPVAFTLLAAIALVVVAELVRLLAATRRRVFDLYWSRGDSSRAISLRSLRDVAAAAFLGVLVGIGVVAVALLVTGRLATVPGPGAAGWVTPLLVLGVALVVSWSSTRSVGGADRTRVVRQRRQRRAAVPGLAILATLAAAVSVWQLRLYGSPLTPTVDGTGGVDPVAVVAPAAALVACVLLLLAVFPTLASAYSRRSGRSSIVTQLAARGLIGRVALLTAPLIVVALAVGSATTAASFAATWDTAFRQTAALRTGADLHAIVRIQGFTSGMQDAAVGASSVTSVAPLEVQPLSVGNQAGTIVGATPEAVATVAAAVPGAFDPATTADNIRYDIPGPIIPADASSLSLTVDAVGFVAPPTAALWLADELGFLRLVPLQLESSEATRITYTDASWRPPTAGPWRIAGIDFRFLDDQEFGESRAELHLVELAVSAGGSVSEIDLDDRWITDSITPEGAPPTSDFSNAGFFLTDYVTGARMTPSLTDTIDDRPLVPVVVSQQLSDRFSVEVGDSLAFSLQDGIERVNSTVVAVIPAIPGSPRETAMLVDLGVIQHFQLRTTAVPADPRDLWIATSEPDAAAAELRGLLPPSTRIDSREDRAGREVLGSATVVLWGVALAALLLAAVGVGSSARARARSGRNDLGVLRAIGVTDGDQAAIVVREFVVVILLGAIAGLLAGVLVSVLTIPLFARAAITDPYVAVDTVLRFDLVGGAVLLAALALAIIGILVRLGWSVRSGARRAVPGEASE